MKIVPYTIRIRDLVAGYRNDEKKAVMAFGGNLDVRPKYQREFIYSDDEKKFIITPNRTIREKVRAAFGRLPPEMAKEER